MPIYRWIKKVWYIYTVEYYAWDHDICRKMDASGSHIKYSKPDSKTNTMFSLMWKLVLKLIV